MREGKRGVVRSKFEPFKSAPIGAWKKAKGMKVIFVNAPTNMRKKSSSPKGSLRSKVQFLHILSILVLFCCFVLTLFALFDGKGDVFLGGVKCIL